MFFIVFPLLNHFKTFFLTTHLMVIDTKNKKPEVFVIPFCKNFVDEILRVNLLDPRVGQGLNAVFLIFVCTLGRAKSLWGIRLIDVDCGSEIRPENQLRLVVYTTIYKVLYIPGGWPWDFRTINCSELSKC